MFSEAFVCLWVCVFVNTITSKRVNVGWWDLVVGALHKYLGWVRILRSYLHLGAQPPQNVAFCWVMRQDVNKAMWSDETSHRMHPAHRTCVQLQHWEKYSGSLCLPLIPRFKTKVLSELLNSQTSHQSSCFAILLLCEQLKFGNWLLHTYTYY